jgi:Sulfotransferase domain
MMDSKNIIWLASFPKSGNTWFRSFLTALLHEKEVDINDLEEGKIFSRRSTFEEILDIDSNMFSDGEIKNLQPKVYQYLAHSEAKKQFFKIHDAFVKNTLGEYIVPENVTFAAIYFVRNPLDVAISFANHNGKGITETIENMADTALQLGYEASRQLEQPLLTWSQHYQSWTERPSFPVHVVRYEDMLDDTFNVFKTILQNIGLNYTDDAIKTAIDATSFEKLKKQEEEKGFREKNPNSPRFFNNGKSGTWQGKLTDEQIEKIITTHSDVMKKLGYL